MGTGPLTQGFTGRSPEMATVDRVLAAARSGSGSVVLVSGPAGIGKTTFSREVLARARRAGFQVAWGACWLLGGAPPLWPWGQILGDLGGTDLGDLLAQDTGGVAVNPERFARFAAVLRGLSDRCRQRPAMIIIDDIQAAEAGALLLCRFLARNLADVPLVLLLASRSTDSLDLGNEATRVPLRPFGIGETAALIRARGLAVPEDHVLELFVRLTGGHPLHLDRLLAAGSHAVDAGATPDVSEVIEVAIDDLGEPAQTALSRAAVVGPRMTIARATIIADVSVQMLKDAVDQAARLGLVSASRTDSIALTYGHELIRAAFASRLDPDERMNCHARAAAELDKEYGLSSSRPGDVRARDQLGEYAFHATRAAPRSSADARIAIAACQLAADAMARAYAYEEAVTLLDSAIAAHRGLPDAPAAALLVSRAEAVLRCGRLAEARRRFDEAVVAAIAEQDAVALAHGALGLGGVWVNENRTLIEWDRVTGLQRQALAGLPTEQRVLRQRLTMRLAAEDLYRGGSAVDVANGLAEARRIGDGRALAEALSLAHHALLTAAGTRQRLPLAEELISVAAPAGEGLLALFGLCWRTVDLFHLGDRRAVPSLAELRERAETLGCQSILHTANAMGVMLLIRSGRLEEAERAAYDCHRLGTEVGDPDADAYLTAQLSTIRWFQGREGEMARQLSDLVSSSSLNPAEFAFSASAAHLMARMGEADRAASLLAALAEGGLARLPDSSTWLTGLNEIVEAAHLVGDAGICRQAYDLLAPFADLPITPSLAVTCLGSVHRPLGLASLTVGDHDEGIRRLTAAIQTNRSLGNQPMTAIATADLAEAYLARNRSGEDRQKATALLTEAVDLAAGLGMSTFADSWRRRRDEVSDQVGMIDKVGDGWVLRLGGRRVHTADRVGVQYLVQLLINPGRSISALELAAGASSFHDPNSDQAVLDEQAKQEYRRRLTTLDAAIADAESQGDGAEADALMTERDALIDQLRRATGLTGRTRSFADSGERARTAVRKALMRTVEEISRAEPTLGEHLRSSLSTGSTCCYSPDRERPVRWRLGATTGQG